MIQPNYQYVFGPVPSRRLGRSLGIDLVPYKTCSYDCIYCQLGRTTHKTIQRDEWFSIDTLMEQLQHRLDELQTPPDYITLSGSGEPTLFSRIDDLIDRVKAITSVPIAILTNGSLLWDRNVRKQLMKADLIVPSLDAGDETLFRYVNRPHESISFHQMLEGLIQMREEFPKPYWLEVFLLAGHNAIRSEIQKIIRCVETIQPDRVQLNTVARPPAEDFAYCVPEDHLRKISLLFDPPAETIAHYQGTYIENPLENVDQTILSLLRRRSCTLNDLSTSLGIPHNSVIKSLDRLAATHQVTTQSIEKTLYYSGIVSEETKSNL